MFKVEVLIVLFFIVFVFVVIISGISFVINENDVIRIGWKCCLVVLIVVLVIDKFCWFFCIVYFIISMVFLLSNLISIIKLSCV